LNDHSIVKSRVLSLILRGVLCIGVLALVVLVFYLYQKGEWWEIAHYYRSLLSHKRLSEFIASFGPFAALIFVIIQAFQVMAAPIPGEMTGFVGGFLFGKVWGIVLSTIGLTIGSLLAFGVAKRFGMRIVERVVKKRYIAKFNFFVTHKGLYITFIMFLLPGFPKDALCYFLGLTRLRFLDFALMNVFGRLPGTMMLTLQGNAVREGKYQTFFWLLAVTVILIILLYFTRNYIIGFVRQMVRSIVRSVIRRKKKKRRKARRT